MHANRSERGSVLITAAMVAIVIAIVLASYLQLGYQSMKLADRSFYANAAMNLTDTGLEQALWSVNHGNWTGAGFSERDGFSSQWQGTFPAVDDAYQFQGGMTGQVKVWMDTAGSSPHAIAKAIITLHDGTRVIKEAEAYLQTRSFFSNGMVAKDTVTFSGNNAEVDSWNSDPDNDPGTPFQPYIGSGPSKNSHDGGTVASTSVHVDAVNVSNANIYGFVAIGGSTIDGISVGPNGMVGPYGTPNGTIDTSHVTYDFTQNFPDIAAPTETEKTPTQAPVALTPMNTNTLAAITGSMTLPRTNASHVITDVAAADGNYYYYVPSITLSGNAASGTLVVAGPNDASGNPTKVKVVIMIQNATTSVSVTGHGGINIGTGSTLAMYAAGSIAIAGNGVTNGSYDPLSPLSAANSPNQPVEFQLYGTKPAAETPPYQSISISGNGVLSAAVYAPNASVEMKGGGNNGQVLGAMVGQTISLTGNSIFHFDESLKNFGGSSSWSMAQWDELSSASDRQQYATQLDF